MTLEAFTHERILEDTAKLQYLFGLKKVIRYDQNRHATDSTESVAEHVYGMHILAQYFLPLENLEGTWDRARIYEMITLHDIDEIETGDVLGYTKTAETRALELEAMKRTIEKSPHHLQQTMRSHAEEYEGKQTPEARFVKAIDKIEPLFQIFNEEGRLILKMNRTTAEQSLSIKAPYIAEFPFIKKCTETIHKELIDGGYYWSEGE
ncbi:MAG: HD domain-containing protein [Candidatus Pacebacteria bacterium]|nr:HD domain-containing protein [Candidatus Paceibacterota bacterium]